MCWFAGGSVHHPVCFGSINQVLERNESRLVATTICCAKFKSSNSVTRSQSPFQREINIGLSFYTYSISLLFLMYLLNLSERLTWVNHVKGHGCLDSLVFSRVNYFLKYLALYCKILFLLVCLLCFCNFSIPAHSALPIPCSPLHHFRLCEFQKCKSLVTPVQLYLYSCFSPNYHNHPVRSWRVIGRWVQRRQIPLGRLTLLPMVLYPGPLLIFAFLCMLHCKADYLWS